MIAAQSALHMKELSKNSADQQEGLCSIWVSFVEIYNEYIYDLLQPNISNRAKLQLGEDQNGDVYVKGRFLLKILVLEIPSFFFFISLIFEIKRASWLSLA